MREDFFCDPKAVLRENGSVNTVLIKRLKKLATGYHNHSF